MNSIHAENIIYFEMKEYTRSQKIQKVALIMNKTEHAVQSYAAGRG